MNLSRTRLLVASSLLCASAFLAACEKSAPPAPPAQPAAPAADGVQEVRINVTDMGYEPASVELKAGVPARLVFNQQSKQGCVKQVMAPDFKVPVTDLPFGKETAITFTPAQAGTFKWTCGMNMMKGAIIVKG